MTLTPVVNHGRWLVQCPDCKSWFEARDDTSELFCVVCFPDLKAKAFKLLPNGLYRPVNDAEKQAEARAAVLAAGKNYRIEFPANRRNIERVLAKRPAENRNWFIGETVEDLNKENAAHNLARVEA